MMQLQLITTAMRSGMAQIVLSSFPLSNLPSLDPLISPSLQQPLRVLALNFERTGFTALSVDNDDADKATEFMCCRVRDGVMSIEGCCEGVSFLFLLWGVGSGD